MLIQYKDFDTNKYEAFSDPYKIDEVFKKIQLWNSDLTDYMYTEFFDAIFNANTTERKLSILRGYLESNTNIFGNLHINSITIDEDEGLDRYYIEKVFSIQSNDTKYDRTKNWSTSENKTESVAGLEYTTKTDYIDDSNYNPISAFTILKIVFYLFIAYVFFVIGWKILLAGIIIYIIYRIYKKVKNKTNNTESINTKSSNICQHCGTENKEDSNYCINCGEKISS